MVHFSRYECGSVKSLSHVQLLGSYDGVSPARLLCPWGFSRQEYWSGLPRSPPGDLPDPGFEPGLPVLQVNSLPTELVGNINLTL